MPRPRRFSRILGKPRVCRFEPDIADADKIEPLMITMEEFESLRLKDYQEIQQKKAAEIMDISQPTFHRTLSSARRKITKALVEGKIIQIKGGDYIMDKKRYVCKNCGFEWQSASKEYNKCPDCDSENIELISVDAGSQIPTAQLGLGRRRGAAGGGMGSRRGGGMGAGPPRVCKCPECGYESPKTPGVPCLETKCPKCGLPLYGSD
ncbi:MAG TPA: DUF134 domain-containing protein [Methanobacterium sp.]|jgi:hypothetical protein|nr:DUF134 domain-containing protein [Methanobacterium sp.]